MRMVILSTIAALIAGQASAQSCIGYPDAAELLAGKHKESVAVRGLDHRGAMLEFWVNPSTGSWTLIAVTPQGMACPVASGNGAETYPAKPNV